jgi:predicted nucleic acid-binding protein
LKQVLDTRFLVEYYYSPEIETRKKALQKLKELIQSGNGIIPTIVVLEIVRIVAEREGKDKAEIVYLWLITLGLKIENLTPYIAKEAGILKSTHKHLPTGDCIIATIAIKNQARIISDDPHFDAIEHTHRTWL